MNINQAKYILTILSEGSFSAAANKLFLSQSALSQTVHAVEQSIGGKVFEKRNNKLTLTYSGELYIEAAKRIIQIEDELSRELHSVKNECGGVRFGIPAQQSMSMLPRILSRFCPMYPKVDIALTEQGSNMLTAMAARQEIDIAVARTEQNNAQLEYRVLQNEKMCIIAGRGTNIYSKYKNGQSISAADAANDRFVYLKSGHNARAVQDMLCIRLGVEFPCFIETDSFETARRVAADCACAMIAPYSMAVTDADALHGAKVFPLTDEINVLNTCLVYSKNLHLKKYMLDFIEQIEALYAESGLE